VLALDQDLFRRLGPYRDIFPDHAVADAMLKKQEAFHPRLTGTTGQRRGVIAAA
jgi:hypothetical protein